MANSSTSEQPGSATGSFAVQPSQAAVVVCGATGNVGSSAVRSLAALGQRVRAVVRRDSATAHLAQRSVRIHHADIRDPDSLRPVLSGADVVVCAVTAMTRYMAGDHSSRIRDVDAGGKLALVKAAEDAGVRRFVHVSYPRAYASAGCALIDAGRAVERRLAASPMRVVTVRADPYADLWLSAQTGFDPAHGRIRIVGTGTRPIRFTSTADVGRAVAELAIADNPPDLIELAAAEAISFVEAAELAQELTGVTAAIRHVPRVALRLGATAFKRLRPELASALALGLAIDTQPGCEGPGGFTALGIEPRGPKAYLRSAYAPAGRATV